MDVVMVPDDKWQEYGAQGSGKHLNCVLADASTLAPLLVIELDDKSHWQEDVQKRDAFKNAALASAGVRVLR
jgi:very-short-patch-repair endonuclease